MDVKDNNYTSFKKSLDETHTIISDLTSQGVTIIDALKKQYDEDYKRMSQLVVQYKLRHDTQKELETTQAELATAESEYLLRHNDWHTAKAKNTKQDAWAATDRMKLFEFKNALQVSEDKLKTKLNHLNNKINLLHEEIAKKESFTNFEHQYENLGSQSITKSLSLQDKYFSEYNTPKTDISAPSNMSGNNQSPYFVAGGQKISATPFISKQLTEGIVARHFKHQSNVSTKKHKVKYDVDSETQVDTKPAESDIKQNHTENHEKRVSELLD